VWVRHREHSKEANGELNGKVVGTLERLFRVWYHVKREHEVALVSIPWVWGSSKPGREEGIFRIEHRSACRRLHIVWIADIEGIAHLIEVKQHSMCLVNNRIDLNIWNKLYD